MDRGAWQATAPRIAESEQLKLLSAAAHTTLKITGVQYHSQLQGLIDTFASLKVCNLKVCM